MNIMNISYNIDKIIIYINNLVTIIYNYFIDNTINIKDDDNFNVKIKKYLLKYKKAIGLILLIILLIIGYYCDPYNFIYDDVNIKKENIQDGGSIETVKDKEYFKAQSAKAKAEAQAQAEAAKEEANEEAKAAKDKAAKDKAIEDAKPKPGFKDKLKSAVSKAKTGQSEKMQASFDLKKDKLKGAVKAMPGKALAGIKQAPTAFYDAGATAARAFKDNSDIIYQIFYSIALFIIICIVAIPTVALFVIGIICYFLLKDKMKTLKSL